jgi:hypothetical protein
MLTMKQCLRMCLDPLMRDFVPFSFFGWVADTALFALGSARGVI